MGLGFRSTCELDPFWVSDTNHAGVGRIEFIKNRNSDDPRISWSLTIVADEGWHMQGFIQRRGTARKLLAAAGFLLNEPHTDFDHAAHQQPAAAGTGGKL